MMGCVFNVVANCWVHLYLKKLLQRFSYKSSKNDYHLNITITQFAMLHRILSAKPYTNHLKFHPLCCLLPMHGCNLALLPDNYNATNYRLAEILLFLRLIHCIVCSIFVVMFFLSFLWKHKHFVTLHKIVFHQM